MLWPLRCPIQYYRNHSQEIKKVKEVFWYPIFTRFHILARPKWSQGVAGWNTWKEGKASTKRHVKNQIIVKHSIQKDRLTSVLTFSGKGQWTTITPTITHATPVPGSRSSRSSRRRSESDNKKKSHRAQKDNASIESKSSTNADKSTAAAATTEGKSQSQQTASKAAENAASLEAGHSQRGAYRGRGGATRGRGRGRGGFGQGSTGAPYINGRPKPGYVNVDAETLKAFLLQQL